MTLGFYAVGGQRFNLDFGEAQIASIREPIAAATVGISTVRQGATQPAGAHREPALHPIRSTINSWDLWASGDSMQAAGRRAPRNGLSIRVRGTRFSRGPLGERQSQVAGSVAQRERGSLCSVYQVKGFVRRIRDATARRRRHTYQDRGDRSLNSIHNNDHLSRAFSNHTRRAPAAAIGTRSHGNRSHGMLQISVRFYLARSRYMSTAPTTAVVSRIPPKIGTKLASSTTTPSPIVAGQCCRAN